MRTNGHKDEHVRYDVFVTNSDGTKVYHCYSKDAATRFAESFAMDGAKVETRPGVDDFATVPGTAPALLTNQTVREVSVVNDETPWRPTRRRK